MLEVDDLVALRSAHRARIAPDGRYLAYLTSSVEMKADRERTELQVVELGSEEEREIAAAVPGDSPSWSPDGCRLAFLADVDGRSEIRLLSLADGATRRLALLPGAGRDLAWSPRGDLMALEVRAEAGGEGRIGVVDTGTGAVELIPAAKGQVDTSPAWSADGRRLAFARLEEGSAGSPPAGSIQLWTVDAGGDARLVPTDLSFATCPSWSPDGALLACVGTAEPRLGSADPCLQPWVLPPEGGTARLAAPGVRGVVLSPFAEGPVWDRDGSAIFFREARGGEINVVRAEIGQAAVALPPTQGRQVVDFSFTADGAFAFSAWAPTDPGSVRVVTGGEVRHLRGSVGAWARSRGKLVPTPSRRRFRSPHGHRLDGWLQGLDPNRSPQPLLVSMHGGPHGFFGPGFQLGHFYRNVLASRGWLVLALNSTGSGSYGTAFADAIRGRWGEYDLPEHTSAMEELVADGLADPDRLAVAGYSYGGYLATWAVCHEDCFKAAVVGAPITDLAAFERTSDIGAWYTPWEMRGSLSQEAARYERLSPITYAGQIETPILLLHGLEDRRCPARQSEILAERMAAIERGQVELVRYEGADHLFYSRGCPSRRLDFNRRIVDWLERHVNGGDADG